MDEIFCARARRSFVGALVVLSGLSAISGCRTQEQDRVGDGDKTTENEIEENENGTEVFEGSTKSESETDDSAGSDDSGQSSTDPETGTDTLVETGSDPSGGGAAGSDTADVSTDSEDSPRVAQHPIVFRVVNKTDSPIYVPLETWIPMDAPIIAKQRQKNGDWTWVADGAPFCMAHCREDHKNTPCCLACDAEWFEGVRVIEPGEVYEETWGGRVVKIDEAPCQDGCQCYSTDHPMAGEYRALIPAGLEMECPSGHCWPTGFDESLIRGAKAETVSTYTAEFEVPFDGETVVLEVTSQD